MPAGETTRAGEGSPRPHVAAVILHWGPVEVTARCLQSLREASFPGRRTVILIDNTCCLDRSLAGSVAPLEIEVHRPDRNLGFAKGCAWGISLALKHGADFILLLNNDVIVEPLFLDALLKAAAEWPAAGLLCPRIVSLADPPRPWYMGGTFSLWSGIPVQARSRWGADIRGYPREVDYATGCVVLITPAVIHAVGSFDPQFFAYCEDLDLSLRARQAGFTILFVPESDRSRRAHGLLQHAESPRGDAEARRLVPVGGVRRQLPGALAGVLHDARLRAEASAAHRGSRQRNRRFPEREARREGVFGKTRGEDRTAPAMKGHGRCAG